MTGYIRSKTLVCSLSTAATIAACGITTMPSNAAPIAWSTAFEINSDADIDLTYPIFYAQNGGDSIGNTVPGTGVTINPQPDPLPVNIGGQTVNFEGIDTLYGTASEFGALGFVFETFGDADDHFLGQNFNVTFGTTNFRTVSDPQVSLDLADTNTGDPRTYGRSTGNSDLDRLLNSQVFVDGRTSAGAQLNISLNNLTPSTAYQIQLIGAADDRDDSAASIDPLADLGTNSGSISPIMIADDGLGNTANNLSGLLDLDNDGIGHVTSLIGTFTADSTSQPINLTMTRGRNGGISGLVVSVIPEPASAALVGLSGTTMLRRRRA